MPTFREGQRVLLDPDKLPRDHPYMPQIVGKVGQITCWADDDTDELIDGDLIAVRFPHVIGGQSAEFWCDVKHITKEDA